MEVCLEDVQHVQSSDQQDDLDEVIGGLPKSILPETVSSNRTLFLKIAGTSRYLKTTSHSKNHILSIGQGSVLLLCYSMMYAIAL